MFVDDLVESSASQWVGLIQPLVLEDATDGCGDRLVLFFVHLAEVYPKHHAHKLFVSDLIRALVIKHVEGNSGLLSVGEAVQGHAVY